MTLEMIRLNIANLQKWLKESPKDEDYLRLLNEYVSMEKHYVQKN